MKVGKPFVWHRGISDERVLATLLNSMRHGESLPQSASIIELADSSERIPSQYASEGAIRASQASSEGIESDDEASAGLLHLIRAAAQAAYADEALQKLAVLAAQESTGGGGLPRSIQSIRRDRTGKSGADGDDEGARSDIEPWREYMRETSMLQLIVVPWRVVSEFSSPQHRVAMGFNLTRTVITNDDDTEKSADEIQCNSARWLSTKPDVSHESASSSDVANTQPGEFSSSPFSSSSTSFGWAAESGLVRAQASGKADSASLEIVRKPHVAMAHGLGIIPGPERIARKLVSSQPIPLGRHNLTVGASSIPEVKCSAMEIISSDFI